MCGFPIHCLVKALVVVSISIAGVGCARQNKVHTTDLVYDLVPGASRTWGCMLYPTLPCSTIHLTWLLALLTGWPRVCGIFQQDLAMSVGLHLLQSNVGFLFSFVSCAYSSLDQVNVDVVLTVFESLISVIAAISKASLNRARRECLRSRTYIRRTSDLPHNMRPSPMVADGSSFLVQKLCDSSL